MRQTQLIVFECGRIEMLHRFADALFVLASAIGGHAALLREVGRPADALQLFEEALECFRRSSSGSCSQIGMTCNDV